MKLLDPHRTFGLRNPIRIVKAVFGDKSPVETRTCAGCGVTISRGFSVQDVAGNTLWFADECVAKLGNPELVEVHSQFHSEKQAWARARIRHTLRSPFIRALFSRLRYPTSHLSVEHTNYLHYIAWEVVHDDTVRLMQLAQDCSMRSDYAQKLLGLRCRARRIQLFLRSELGRSQLAAADTALADELHLDKSLLKSSAEVREQCDALADRAERRAKAWLAQREVASSRSNTPSHVHQPSDWLRNWPGTRFPMSNPDRGLNACVDKDHQ
jgi:hypothetical protein